MRSYTDPESLIWFDNDSDDDGIHKEYLDTLRIIDR